MYPSLNETILLNNDCNRLLRITVAVAAALRQPTAVIQIAVL